MERLRTIWEFLRISFWFVPSLMTIAGIGLLAAMVSIDQQLTEAHPATPWFLYVGSRADALTVLSTVLASMITMTTLVFSITMVVLTLAASQFGPRLIRNFMANPQTQIVLGTFVMTCVYCLLGLPALELRVGAEELPYASVSLALALTLVSLCLLVLFLDSLARSIVSETVIERVGGELDKLFEDFAPLQEAEQSETRSDKAIPDDLDQRGAFFGPKAAGYVLAIQYDALTAAAKRADVLIALYFRAGHYVVPGAPEIAVYPCERLSQELAAEIRDAIIIGIHRTPVQDPDFSIRHLEEIAVRALSRAVNDPYTAVAVIDRLSASLSKLMGRALPSGVFRDGGGVVRVIATAPTYAGLIGAGFNQIRQDGSDKPIIVLHLLEAIERIAQHVRRPTQHSALAAQADAIMRAARRHIDDRLDCSTIDERYRAVQRTLNLAALRWSPEAADSGGRNNLPP